MNNQYRKRPIVIQAFQMTKDRRWDNSEWPNWLHEAWNREPGENALWCEDGGEQLYCGTLEGVHVVTWDDWIIRGVAGELYPCKPDIFEQTYEAPPQAPVSGFDVIGALESAISMLRDQPDNCLGSVPDGNEQGWWIRDELIDALCKVRKAAQTTQPPTDEIRALPRYRLAPDPKGVDYCNRLVPCPDGGIVKWSELEAAINRASEVSEWQPIETAPEDDWLLLNDQGTLRIGTYAYEGGSPFHAIPRRIFKTPSGMSFPATHWMPQPPPPRDPQESE